MLHKYLEGFGKGGSCISLDTSVHVTGVGLDRRSKSCGLHQLQDSCCAYMVSHLQQMTAHADLFLESSCLSGQHLLCKVALCAYC